MSLAAVLLVAPSRLVRRCLREAADPEQGEWDGLVLDRYKHELKNNNTKGGHISPSIVVEAIECSSK